MILVTGAAGLSGSIAIREFARQGVPVRALVRDRARAAALAGLPGVEIAEGDMLRAGTLTDALKGVRRAFMISSSGREMVATQCNFIDACRKAGVAHVVKFSGAEPDFDPDRFPFTRMHEEIEDYLEQSGLAWTHLRPSQFMQVYLREAKTIVEQDALRLPLDDAQLEPVDLHDVAKIAVPLLRDGGHEGRSYDITGPEALTMADIAERISQAVGRPIRYVPITLEERRTTLLAAGLPPFFVDAFDGQTKERLRRRTARLCLGAHEAFGVAPTTFAQFARANAAAFGARQAAA